MSTDHYSEYYEYLNSPAYYENKKNAERSKAERVDFAYDLLVDFIKGRRQLTVDRVLSFVSSEVTRRFGPNYGPNEARTALWLGVDRKWRFTNDSPPQVSAF